MKTWTGWYRSQSNQRKKSKPSSTLARGNFQSLVSEPGKEYAHISKVAGVQNAAETKMEPRGNR
jgi:hypothetical protein